MMIDNNSDLSEHFGKNNKNKSVQKPKENSNTIENYDYLNHDEEYYENIRRRMRERRIKAEKRRVRRNRIVAAVILLIIISVIFLFCFRKCGNDQKDNGQVSSQNEKNTSENLSAVDKENTKDNSQNTDNNNSLISSDASSKNDMQKNNPKIEKVNGLTFVDGILIVNKTYSVPASYDPQTSQIAYSAFNKMSEAAANEGITLFINSGYRSYQEQKELYDGYVAERGTEAADEVSSRPGHSEHQTGLTFDVNTTEFSFENTPEAIWLAKHCCEYGFIIRYPKGKEEQTGYAYEPWHIRYLGVEKATEITKSGLCLEEYLGITSDYKYAEDEN